MCEMIKILVQCTSLNLHNEYLHIYIYIYVYMYTLQIRPLQILVTNLASVLVYVCVFIENKFRKGQKKGHIAIQNNKLNLTGVSSSQEC